MTEWDPHDPRLLTGDVDFYCLECGYNLRGLAGDPKRCPECFHLNPINELSVTAKEINRQLGRLETGPTCCVAAFVAIALGVLAIIRGGWELSLLMFLAAVALWVGGAGSFSDSCGGRPGWFRALVRFQMYGLGIMVIGLGLPGAVFGVVFQRFARADITGWMACCLVVPLSAGLPFVLVCRFVCMPLHRWAKAEMNELQRETAVTWARRHRRETLSQQMAPRKGRS